ncbi:MAG TPA: PilZ domain-containing protein [Candidatus Aquilonibacter sp.]|nr:PilZ domain-containing protein [Candidatus Aquilonibacter sp.]
MPGRDTTDSETMAQNPKASLRRYPRIETPQGLWVAWQREGIAGTEQTVSRVRDLNVGGLYILTNQPLPAGEKLSFLFSVAEGEIRGSAVVRNQIAGNGMGVEFEEMGSESSVRLEALVVRLLKSMEAKGKSQ